MKLRTLSELGNDTNEVQLIENTDQSQPSALHLAGTDIILVPQPSSDVNDPLRWPQWRKWNAFLQVCFIAFMTTAVVGGISPGLVVLSVEFDKDVSATTGLITWVLLVNGLGNFFWVPCAEYFGKRPVFVFSSLLLFVSCIWSAASKSFGSLLAARIISGFAGASSEGLGTALIDDLFYLHERGSKMGVYMIFLSSGNAVGPLISGFMVEKVGWRAFVWLCAGLCGLNFLAVFCFCYETRFDRISDKDADSSVSVSVSVHEVQTSGGSDKTPASPVLEHVSTAPAPGQTTGTKKTLWQDLSLWSGVSKNSFFSHSMRPFPLLVYPAVAWGTLMFGVGLGWQIGANSLSSFVLQSPPYSFSPGINGLINIPALLGAITGSILGGHLTDIYARRATKRNGGRFQAESRLPMCIIPGILTMVGLVLFGCGARRYLHWIALYIGYALIHVNIGVPAVAMSYILDIYPEVAAEAMLMVNGTKNVIAFGFTYSFIPWVGSAGYEVVFGAMAGIYAGCLLLGIPLYLLGPRAHKYTAEKMRIIFW